MAEIFLYYFLLIEQMQDYKDNDVRGLKYLCCCYFGMLFTVSDANVNPWRIKVSDI